MTFNRFKSPSSITYTLLYLIEIKFISSEFYFPHYLFPVVTFNVQAIRILGIGKDIRYLTSYNDEKLRIYLSFISTALSLCPFIFTFLFSKFLQYVSSSLQTLAFMTRLILSKYLIKELNCSLN